MGFHQHLSVCCGHLSLSFFVLVVQSLALADCSVCCLSSRFVLGECVVALWGECRRIFDRCPHFASTKTNHQWSHVGALLETPEGLVLATVFGMVRVTRGFIFILNISVVEFHWSFSEGFIFACTPCGFPFCRWRNHVMIH